MRVILFLLLSMGPLFGEDLEVHTDFPGGSGKVLGIDQGQHLIRLNPTPHKDRGWECWWYTHITGVTPGETIKVEVGEAPWATPDRATFSTDQKTWRHTAAGTREGKRIRYEVKVDTPEFWIAWGPPFVPADAKALVDKLASRSPAATAFNLCETREGRQTPGLRLTAPEGDASVRRAVWIQARQHAWESGSSWVATGLAEWLASEEPRAVSLRENAEVFIIPVMDIDNVHRGAGGKNQKPQDHNRDWTDEPHWHAVAAAQERIRALNGEGRFDLFVDLHNPGAGSKLPYYYIPPRENLSPVGKEFLERFLGVSRREIVGPLRFIGKTIESGREYDPKAWEAISKNWVASHCADHVVAVTLETAWNTPVSTTEGYKAVGRQLGLAIELFLRQSKVEP